MNQFFPIIIVIVVGMFFRSTRPISLAGIGIVAYFRPSATLVVSVLAGLVYLCWLWRFRS